MVYYTTLFAILLYSVGYTQNPLNTDITEITGINQITNNLSVSHCDTTPADHVTRNITVNTARLEWDAQPNASSYIIEGGVVGGLPITINRPATNDTIEHLNVSGLFMGNSYYWRIRAILCDSVEGNWSEADTFTVPICETPTNLTTVIHPNNSVTISWDAMPVAVGYLVRGGTAPQPSPAEVQFINEAANTSITTGSLLPGTYSWKVLTGCDDNPLVLSPFSQYATFIINAPPQKYSYQESAIYPNPAKDHCYINMENLREYRILSLTGIELLLGTENRVNLESLPTGLYLLQIVTDKGFLIERLVVSD